jgi:signal transduction histidine kinase/CheY-like chemotaxis protein
VSGEKATVEFERERVAELLRVLELMAGGDTTRRLRISSTHDELDGIAHGINVVVSELGWATARLVDGHKERALAAERANNAKNVFVRNMSHEIRTPLTAMLGFADLLARPDVTPQERADLLRKLQDSGSAVLSLVNDLLDLARLEAQKTLLVPELVHVVDLVRDVVDSLEVARAEKGLDIQIDARPDAAGILRTDRVRLRQILLNVVGNAVKFTDRGRIIVSVRTDNGEGTAWSIDVADTGIGIDAEERPNLFEPFGQADASISRRYGGSGLGLALSRRLAEQLGGSLVLLRSARHEGSTFRLTLKALEVASPPEGRAATTVQGPAPNAMRGMRVLLADDHQGVHLAMRKLLERAGARVESAYDGPEAVSKALSCTVDLVLMDLGLPRRDGLQAARELRRLGFSAPIVAITADLAGVYRAEALEAGCDACLSKPFNLGELMTCVRSTSSRRPVNAPLRTSS